jgi:hypothetical protein
VRAQPGTSRLTQPLVSSFWQLLGCQGDFLRRSMRPSGRQNPCSDTVSRQEGSQLDTVPASVVSAPWQAMHLQNQATVNVRTYAAAGAGQSRVVALLSLTLTVLVFLTLAGCRRGMPVDTAPQAATPADGTLRGTIRRSAGSIPVEGRTVEVVNVTTGQSQRVTTGDSGGFSMRLTPGTYRVDLVLRGGESVVQRPGIIELDSSDPGARADFVVGPVPVSRPRGPAYRIDDGLGSPIA